MRIVCPSCSAVYEVPDPLVTASRSVRCARCGGEWTLELEVAAVPEPPPPLVAEPPPPSQASMPPAPAPTIAPVRPSAMERLAAQPAIQRPPIALRTAWVTSVLLLVLAVGASLVWRDHIVTAWPPSARAYAMFGLKVGVP